MLSVIGLADAVQAGVMSTAFSAGAATWQTRAIETD